MWNYEAEYNKLTDQEKVKRLETLCKTYLMYLNIPSDIKHPNLFMKDVTLYWDNINKDFNDMGGN